MRCPKCSKEIADGSDFCRFCGMKVIREVKQKPSNVLICPKCKKELVKDSDFCRFCGAKIVRVERETSAKISQIKSLQLYSSLNMGFVVVLILFYFIDYYISLTGRILYIPWGVANIVFLISIIVQPEKRKPIMIVTPITYLILMPFSYLLFDLYKGVSEGSVQSLSSGESIIFTIFFMLLMLVILGHSTYFYFKTKQPTQTEQTKNVIQKKQVTCPKCGSKLGKYDIFCQVCGKKVK